MLVPLFPELFGFRHQSFRLATSNPSSFWRISWNLRITMGYILSASFFEACFLVRGWVKKKSWSAQGRSGSNQIFDMATDLMHGSLWFVRYNYGSVGRLQHGVSHRYAMKTLSLWKNHGLFCYFVAHLQTFSLTLAFEDYKYLDHGGSFQPRIGFLILVLAVFSMVSCEQHNMALISILRPMLSTLDNGWFSYTLLRVSKLSFPTSVFKLIAPRPT